MKEISCCLFLLLSISVLSQEKFAKEFSFVNDNDLYVSISKDRYYTNGMFLTYRHLTKNNNEKLAKKIYEWQVGQYMYTPFKAVITSVKLHDRPFAAYLYGSFGINRIYKNNSTLKTSLQIGVIGPAAYGEELQGFIHDIYNFSPAVGWKYQIKNAFGINLNASYNKFLISTDDSYFDIHWINDIKVGTVFTNLSTGFYTRIGFKPLQSIINSIGFNTSLNNDTTNQNRVLESFLYFKPIIRYSHYDATIQGSFLNKNSDVTKELYPIVFDLELGVKFTVNRFNFGYVFNYNTNKSKDLRITSGHSYGSIILSYLIR
ncbi:hypothetical protein OD91_2566 [Lutibacter sp. Hel_I_33_5]|uniref:lipid A deacylase LpxR family protein n=1 Tax=Lutibacter sp. Hel_I_33_5 TaxID=1566289 RepID=UPI0011A06EA5|nr:lipid A deacylase LpxR family protein [Lutibacter sp. Hel_I_33_5]TVZ57248.1 hypothetical protein OD91_2566 [Lutibacter sp. Hel_I_33_5]